MSLTQRISRPGRQSATRARVRCGCPACLEPPVRAL